MRSSCLLIAVPLVIALPAAAAASWLSDITGINIDIPRGRVEVGRPNPAAIVPMIQNLPRDAATFFLNPAGPALATAIRYSKAQAQSRGVAPIPSEVKNQLSPYFPTQILDRVRHTTSSGGITIDAILTGWLQQEGAVTLEDVVVFSDGRLASDVALWAHELTHVMQYANMGVEGFAAIYASVPFQLEQQARENSDRITAVLNDSRGGYQLSLTPGAFQSQIPWSAMHNAARNIIDPSECLWVSGSMTGNSCPITIVVTNGYLLNLATGQEIEQPCTGPACRYPAGASGPVTAPPGYTISRFVAGYAE